MWIAGMPYGKIYVKPGDTDLRHHLIAPCAERVSNKYLKVRFGQPIASHTDF
jgi:hypothetical protein